MNTQNFVNLIQLITGRDFTIKTEDTDIQYEKEYRVNRVLPITGMNVGFTWKTPKAEDKLLRSFITAFSTKYREPDPACYDYEYGGRFYSWAEKTDKEREYAFMNHASRMYSKEQLLKQVENNFLNENITGGLLRYGFYNTEYGIGIFCFWMTEGVQRAINIMAKHLQKLAIPYTNEFSDARWVYRFKLGISKEIHLNIIKELAEAA